ncbi:MFS transporter [Sphingomonas sp. S1-29]|uniref:MFS transporter n=1 Tax=Sphingomonas sp. S1-29 TaxID=2991074 RepID=UPI00223F5106|nr:MFS transporter [Sphingomonas sp. S1-29]UZK70280.1 MFS transporter [Sphingomonas sp. S1-29]
MPSLSPQSHVSDDERERGLRLLVVEAAFSGGATALTTGVILTAFALHLGASNTMIGVLASAPFLAQLLQLPAILLVERLRQRKRIAVLTSIVGRSMLAVMALTAFSTGMLPLLILLTAQFTLCGFGAVGSCAWNTWLRDLAPENRLGQVMAKRTTRLTAINLALGVAAAIALDVTDAQSLARDLVFAGMFLIGCIAGLISARMVSAMPEPAMPERSDRVSLVALLMPPLRDSNFKRLLIFVASWQFAVNLATPFFTVFIVRQLGFDASFVMALSVVSQVANILVLRYWGELSDRFANKSVLAICAPVYIFSIVAMIGASQIADRDLVKLWLILLHLAMGASVAGVTLAVSNIALKLSPRGSATAYIAVSATVTAIAAGTAPILGGLLADFFAQRRLELLVRWSSPQSSFSVPILLTSWDFYFLLAGPIGMYAIHRLSLVQEQGEIEPREMMTEMLNNTRRSIRNISSVAGLRAATFVPVSLLRDGRTALRRRSAMKQADQMFEERRED